MSLFDNIVLDTCSILNTPQIIDISVETCHSVYIPRTVINELNYLKDKGKPDLRIKAGLCLGIIIDNRERVIIKESNSFGRNDDRIFAVAEDIAHHKVNEYVYVITNDKDYKLKLNNSGIKIISSSEFMNNTKKMAFDRESSQEFYDYVYNGDIEMVKSFDISGVDLNFIDGETGFTPLIDAVRENDYEMVKYLLSLPGIDINAVDKSKFCLPAISHAIQMHSIGMVKLLIENHANVNAPSKNKTNYFNTPLMIASWSGDYEIVKLLIANGACINQQDQKNGFTALIKAVFKNHPNIVKLLVLNGADTTIYSYEEKTALDYAKETNNNELRCILER